jgi:peroxin-19
MDDKDLDDLLDSALEDFDKKIEPSPQPLSQITTTTESSKSNVTIEKANFYVDDELDYEDRPRTTPVKNKNVLNTNTTKSDEFNQENMKMFDEIFNDEQSKDSMKQFEKMFNMFKAEVASGSCSQNENDDEAKLIKNFEKVMSQLTSDDLNDDDDDDDTDEASIAENFELLKNFTQMASVSTSQVSAEKTSAQNVLADDGNPLTKVLNDINKNSEKVLKNNVPSGFPFDADFLSSMSNGDDGVGATGGIMEPILNMLFSKEILYPSLKLMLDNYDSYISERKDKLSEEEMNKCLAQKVCIKVMCSIYEGQAESDSSEKKSDDLKKILDLLEQCGMPPSELVPDVNPFEALGDQVKGTGCPVS